MDIEEVKITKKQLESLSEKERILVIQFGHVFNELSFLNKLLMMVTDTSTTGIEQRAMVAQSMIVVRLYVGKVFEAWRMLERDYFGSQLSRTLEPEMDPQALEALDKIKTYFGSSNLLAKIRNEFSFHYLSKHIAETMESFSTNYEFELILGHSLGNCLHKFSEDFAMVGMLAVVEEDEPQKAMDTVVGDLSTMGGWFLKFLSYALATVIHKRLGQSLEDFKHDTHVVEPQEDLASFKLPFFFEMSPNMSLETDA